MLKAIKTILDILADICSVYIIYFLVKVLVRYIRERNDTRNDV